VVTTAQGVQQGCDLLRGATPEAWTSQPGRFGRPADLGRTSVVGGRGLAVAAWHQRDAASARHRRRRRAARRHGVKQTQRPSPTEPWLILLTTHRRWLAAAAALRAEAPRSHTAGTSRDAQGGWAGRHGWDRGERVAAATTGQSGETRVGRWALGTRLPSWLGDQLTAAPTPAAIRAVAGEWPLQGRLRVWARGRLALTDPRGRLGHWSPATLQAAAARIHERALPATARAPPSIRRKVA
jgi:hypothetical protein